MQKIATFSMQCWKVVLYYRVREEVTFHIILFQIVYLMVEYLLDQTKKDISNYPGTFIWYIYHLKIAISNSNFLRYFNNLKIDFFSVFNFNPYPTRNFVKNYQEDSKFIYYVTILYLFSFGLERLWSIV